MAGVAGMDVGMGMSHLSKVVGCMVVVGRGGFWVDCCVSGIVVGWGWVRVEGFWVDGDGLDGVGLW